RRRHVDDRLRTDLVTALGVERDADLLAGDRMATAPAHEDEIVAAVEADARHPDERTVRRVERRADRKRLQAVRRAQEAAVPVTARAAQFELDAIHLFAVHVGAALR